MSGQLELAPVPMVHASVNTDLAQDLDVVRAVMYDPAPSDLDLCRLARVLARHDEGALVWTYAHSLGLKHAPRFKLLHDFWGLVGLNTGDLSMLDVEIGVWLKARHLWSPGGSVGGSVSSELTVPVIGGWALRVCRTKGMLGVAPVEWLIMPPNPNPRQRRPSKCWALSLVNLDIFARFMADATVTATVTASCISKEAKERLVKRQREALDRAEQAEANKREAQKLEDELNQYIAARQEPRP